MEQGPASQQASQGGEQREDECLHPPDTTSREDKKSTKSIGTRFLVGTGVTGAVPEICRQCRVLDGICPECS